MTENPETLSVQDAVLYSLHARQQSAIVARLIETSLKRMADRADKRQEVPVWPTLQVVATQGDGTLDVLIEVNMVPPAYRKTAQEAATAPLWRQQLIDDRRRAHEATEALASLQASYDQVREVQRQTEEVLEAMRSELLSWSAGHTLTPANVRRLVAVLNGETEPGEEAPAPSTEAGEAWRQ